MSNLRDYFNEAQDDANDNFFNYEGDENFDFVDDEDNFDVIKDQSSVMDGNEDAWEDLFDIVRSSSANSKLYHKIQGENTDGGYQASPSR